MVVSDIPTLLKRIHDLEAENRDLHRQNKELHRQNKELREAVDALLKPAPSELLEKNRAHPSRQTTI
jgi:cell division protein FtsB